MRLYLTSLLLACLSACGVVDYDTAPEGEFTGSLLVMWVGEGGPAGDGRFVYVPSPSAPLTFQRKAPDGSVQAITPGIMYTDGGSIPRQAQLFSGFSPWGYAPAYMVHDWVFVARHCLNDGTPDETHLPYADMTFHESAEIIAEAIKTLIRSGRVKERDVAPRVISGTVAGPISYQRWVVKGECVSDQVSEAHREEVEFALTVRNLERSGAEALIIAPPGLEPARLVAEFTF